MRLRRRARAVNLITYTHISVVAAPAYHTSTPDGFPRAHHLAPHIHSHGYLRARTHRHPHIHIERTPTRPLSTLPPPHHLHPHRCPRLPPTSPLVFCAHPTSVLPVHNYFHRHTPHHHFQARGHTQVDTRSHTLAVHQQPTSSPPQPPLASGRTTRVLDVEVECVVAVGVYALELVPVEFRIVEGVGVGAETSSGHGRAGCTRR